MVEYCHQYWQVNPECDLLVIAKSLAERMAPIVAHPKTSSEYDLMNSFFVF